MCPLAGGGLLLSENLPDEPLHLARLDVAPGLELAVDQRPVDLDLKPAAIAGDEGQRFDVRLKRLQQLVRQTDGAGQVVSNRAVFNGDFQQHGVSQLVIVSG